jgi:hypothetical protein
MTGYPTFKSGFRDLKNTSRRVFSSGLDGFGKAKAFYISYDR